MILVTGGSGFIGGALKAKLKVLGHEVGEINSANAGVTEPANFEGFRSQGVSHLFHLAAKTYVPDSWDHPADFMQTNLMGTQHALDFCRLTGARLTFVSAYLYGQPESLPIIEESTIRPNNPYAQSKYLAEQLCQFYSQEFQLQINIIRPFNIYGVGQNTKFLIPSIISQALKKERLELMDLTPRRDYLYLDDLIEALLCTLDYAGAESVFNIGSGSSMSVRGIVDSVFEVLSCRKPVISKQSKRRNEIPNVVADISRARDELHWTPQYSFSDGIRQIIEYEKKGGA